MGGSVPIATLIVGTALLGAFALASTALISQTRTAASIDDALPDAPSFQVDNATSNATLVWLNVTNTGDATLDLEHIWFSEDGERPTHLGRLYSDSSFLFPGETILVEYMHGGTAPARISLSAYGTSSAATVV